eukprot:TRINITY_DN83854_c0_g1_i1.p1 TRINITY_DN83854_c0_g1~~TRINITY_DN83854_c0_g1_i1.p1  ORF type:complete len:102 (+),score=9.81 TRINITY_DN83854_c0_g1_i1:32-307(+)
MAEYDIFSEDLPTALEFLAKARAEDRKVLVHCFAGMNRSATVCAAWMLQESTRPLREIVKQLASRRGVVLQNPTFVSGLVSMARQNGRLLA